ncbi:MAG: type II toxin-antitoxin system MqsA family antitoxin [Deferrisomatales bacterium]|nr:type II toxin-antitoxin system MqsA family antitoxin [Deferrisomatales bacterium]
MTCLQCGGAMARGTGPFHVDRKGYHLVFDAVPAWVCGQCGEMYLEAPEVDATQDVIESADRGTERMAASG